MKKTAKTVMSPRMKIHTPSSPGIRFLADAKDSAFGTAVTVATHLEGAGFLRVSSACAVASDSSCRKRCSIRGLRESDQRSQQTICVSVAQSREEAFGDQRGARPDRRSQRP